MPSSGVQTCARSEEHTSELQSLTNLVCRLLLEKKKIHTQTKMARCQYWNIETRSGGCSATLPRLACRPSPLAPYRQPCLAFPSVFFFLKTGPPPNSSPFPHPTLFRT